MIEEKVDVETQIAIIKKDIEKVTFEVERSKKMLNNPAFMAKAPEKLVETEKAKLAAAMSKKEKILESLAALG